MTVSTYTIPINAQVYSPDRADVQVLAAGGVLLIHKTQVNFNAGDILGYGYTVTHKPTGRMVAACRNLSAARELREKLLDLPIDWHSDCIERIQAQSYEIGGFLQLLTDYHVYWNEEE